MAALLDSNVVIDLFDMQSQWREWALEVCGNHRELSINTVIYSELAAGYATMQQLDVALKEMHIILLDIPKEAAFMAAKAFLEYRRRDGSKTGVLPDFFIGAHATVEKLPLITRDLRRYQTYFPDIQLIAP